MCGPILDCSRRSNRAGQSDMFLHNWTKRYPIHFSRGQKQATSVVIGALKLMKNY